MQLTPERLAMIRRSADTGDPFWRGYLRAITDLQPPETPGASSCPTTPAQRKDTP